MWGKKKIKSDKNKKPMKKYYIKGDEKHYIWVKWKSGFEDKPEIVWSAEPQGNYFTKILLLGHFLLQQIVFLLTFSL